MAKEKAITQGYSLFVYIEDLSNKQKILIDHSYQLPINFFIFKTK